MNHVYKVPIIPQNLSKQETIIQVAETLNHLNNVTEDILKHINNRVECSRKKLADISERVDKVNTKINKLKGAKKATQVFSSSKYPAADVNQQYISIFSNVQPPELVKHKVKYKKTTTYDEPVDKLYVYHVKVKPNEMREVASGLGDIPVDVECVNDLLLYSSGKNLYKNFVMSDALDVSQQIREQDYNDSSSIGAAPHSISERSNLTRSSTQNYFYTPNLGEVPALDVPLDLPDLPNVADDLRYDIELGPGIAPSVITTPNIPDLPVIEENVHNIENIQTIELPAPPPVKTQEVEVEIVPIREETPPPPTPPIETEEPQSVKLKPELPQIDNVRSNLMEAIRKVGGAKSLKTVVKNEAPKKPMSGGDLMADLHAKLSMRRKGISGAKKQENNMDASSALEKISAMIPPPVIKENNDNTTEDEDWDD